MAAFSKFRTANNDAQRALRSMGTPIETTGRVA